MNRFTTALLILLLGLIWSQTLHAQSRDHITVILDASGSMSEERMPGTDEWKMDTAKRVLKDVLAKVPTNIDIGILGISGAGVFWVYEPAPLNIDTIKNAIDNIRAGGGTPLGKAIEYAMNDLIRRRSMQSGRTQLVVITDGENTVGKDPSEVTPYLQRNGLAMDTIGVAMSGGREHSLAQASKTYFSANDAKQLALAVQKAIIIEKVAIVDGVSDYDLTANIPIEVAQACLKAVSKAAYAKPGTSSSGAGQASQSNNYVPDPLPSNNGCATVPQSRTASNDLLVPFAIGTLLYFMLIRRARRRV